MSAFTGRVGEAVQRRAAHKTAGSGVALTVLALGALAVAVVVLVCRELAAVVRSAWWVLRTVPALARVLVVGAVVFWVLRDPWFAVPLTVALVGLLVWPWLSQRSSGPHRRPSPGGRDPKVVGSARAILRPWHERAGGLGWPSRVRTSKLRRATSTCDGAATRLDVAIVPGQTTDDVAASAEKLAAATHSVDWTVTPVGPSRVLVDLFAVDVLTQPLSAQMPTEPDTATIPSTVPVGISQSGDLWRLTTAAHTLTAGCTGAGKGSVLWSTLTALAPAIHTGVIRVAGIDLKGGMELGPGRDLFARLATTPEDAVALLEDTAALMTARAWRLAGVQRCHTASVGDPAWLVVVDEMAVLTAYLPDRELKPARRGRYLCC